jgi:acyl-CoA synthetase (AMP-forming)/AMP-acid ligase II
MDFYALLEKQASVSGRQPALIFRGREITFHQLKEAAFQVAAGLQGLGFNKADKTAILLPNLPEYIFSLLAVFLLRGIAVPLDLMLTEEEIIHLLQHSESRFLIAQEKKGLDLAKVKKSCPLLKEIIVFGQDEGAFLSWSKLRDNNGRFPPAETEDKDFSSIFYTSGSTGHPKGVLLTYGHLRNPLRTFEYFLELSDKDILISPGIPFSHLGGLDYLLLMLYFRVTLVLMERFHPLEFLKEMESAKATIFCIVPSMYAAVLSLKEYDKFDLSSLRYAVVFGAPSSPVLLERFHKVCPNAYLLNGWGLTETAAPNSFLPTGTQTKEIPHTGKFPPGTEARLADEAGAVLSGPASGELWLKGSCVMAGYYREPGLTAEVLTSDGWLKTGDIARRDQQGRYAIVGRKKEMLKVAGEIVFCPEVEEALLRHPQIKEAAVIGVADELRGEVPKAFIALKEGGSLEIEELRYFLRGHLAHFKIPHYFEFLSYLPKNRVGKIDKESLKKTSPPAP